MNCEGYWTSDTGPVMAKLLLPAVCWGVGFVLATHFGKRLTAVECVREGWGGSGRELIVSARALALRL